MSKKASSKKKGAPSWAMQPFEQFLADVDHLIQIVRLSAVGISMIRGRPKIIEVLAKVESEIKSEDRPKDKSEELEQAQVDAALAEKEVGTGFPVLHSWAVVGLWALFESMIRTFIAESLRNKRSVWKIESIQRLRIRLGDYESIPREQRYRHVVEMLERETGASLKSGVNRFEAILQPFGLSGDLPALLCREIYELSQVRNLVAHNASTVDRRFREVCPWLSVKVGEKFHISASMFSRYQHCMVIYTTLIIFRVGEQYGVDFSAERKSMFEDVEKFFAKTAVVPRRKTKPTARQNRAK